MQISLTLRGEFGAPLRHISFGSLHVSLVGTTTEQTAFFVTKLSAAVIRDDTTAAGAFPSPQACGFGTHCDDAYHPELSVAARSKRAGVFGTAGILQSVSSLSCLQPQGSIIWRFRVRWRSRFRGHLSIPSRS